MHSDLVLNLLLEAAIFCTTLCDLIALLLASHSRALPPEKTRKAGLMPGNEDY